MNETRRHYVKQNKSDVQRQVLHVFSHMWKLTINKQKHEGLSERKIRIIRDWEGAQARGC